MQKNKRKIRWVAIAMCLIIGGCRKEPPAPSLATEECTQDKIVLNVWHQWTNDTNELKGIYDEAVEKYQQEHKNILIQIHTLDTEAYKTKISAEFAGSAEHIDVFYYWGAGMAEKLVETDKLLPIDNYISEDVWNKIIPESIDAFEFDGKTYALPSFSWYLTLFCNQDIFERAGAKLPETYEELLDGVRKIKQLDGVVPIASGAKDGWNIAMIYQALAMREIGADEVNRMLSGEVGFEDEGYVRAAEKLVELYRNGAFGENPLEAGNDEANFRFINGDAAMRITGSWFANQLYSDTAVKVLPEQIAVLKVPMIEGRGSMSDYCGGFVEAFWVNKNTEYPEEAVDFAVYMNEAVGNAAYHSGSGFSAWNTREQNETGRELFLQIEEYLLESERGVLAWDTSLSPRVAGAHNEYVQMLCTPRADVDAFIEAHRSMILP